MDRRRTLAWLSGLVALASGIVGVSRSPASSTTSERVSSFDNILVTQVAADLPEFGGHFVDENAGTLNVWLTDGGQAEARAAQVALQQALGDDTLTQLTAAPLRADYSFTQLKAWHDVVAREILALPGIVSTDIDDHSNRLKVGVENLALSSLPIKDHLAQLGIPEAAVTIVQRDPVHLESSLRNLHRPLVGGLQIWWQNPGTTDAFICTLGFPAVRNGVNGFVTNSHCSTTQAVVDNILYHQPNNGIPPVLRQDIGRETVDPAFFTGGLCPAGRQCRRSDANFAQLQGSHLCCGPTAIDLGRTAFPPALGTPAWDGQTFEIRSSFNPSAGQAVSKIGRTTGRTEGAVQDVCVNFNVTGTNITMLCQGDADYASSPGDSGAPVVRRATVGALHGTLSGIHWGSGGVFSTFAEIEGEVGELTVCAPGFFC